MVKKLFTVNKIFPLSLATLLITVAIFLFIYNYTSPTLHIFDSNEYDNEFLFKLNFFINITIFFISLFICIIFNNFFSRLFCVIFSFTSCVLTVYVLNDIYSINLLLYIAFIIVIVFSFTPVISTIISLSCIALFIYFLYYPSFMGLLPYDILFSPHDATNIIPFAVILLFTMGSTIIIRELYDKYSHSQKTIEYLSKTEKQLSQFNVQLQQLSRKRNETILRNERLKLTRDLHDTCGYAFTNIILLSDAAISNNKVDTDDVQELYSKIRNLAARGLQETREILHLIRKKQKLYTNTTDIVLEAKSLFEDVTGIKVEITWGNITNNYSHDINKIIVSIIQEAFTNSIKHGQASFIKINFNETYEKLFMSISDNGIGSRQIEKGIGITGMEERLNIVNGKLHISELSEGGFHLTVVIPIQ